MIALTLAIAILAQDMNQAEMMAEGEDIGRSVFAMGTCSGIGYTVHEENAGRWGQDYAERGVAAGWSEDVLIAATQSGNRMEEADLALTAPSHEGDDEVFRARVTALVERIKDRCHRLADEHANLISSLDQGDRNADAQLAIMLRPLDR